VFDAPQRQQWPGSWLRGLRHGALDRPRLIGRGLRCRRRGKGLAAAAAEAPARLRVGVDHRHGQNRQQGAERDHRTKAETKSHENPPESPSPGRDEVENTNDG
jgi:hypothetical protein